MNLSVNAFNQCSPTPPKNRSLDYSNLCYFNYFRDRSNLYIDGRHHPRDYLFNFDELDSDQDMEYYRRSKPTQLPPPKEMPPGVPDDDLSQDPDIEIIGIFPPKQPIKMLIQDAFNKTFSGAHIDVLEPTVNQGSIKKVDEEDEIDDIIIIEPATTTVSPIKSEPIPKIKLRKLASGENIWDFGRSSRPSIEALAPSSSPAVPKPEFSSSTFKDEPGEYMEIPPPPVITLSGLQDCESKPQLWEMHDYTGNGLLPNKSDKRKK